MITKIKAKLTALATRLLRSDTGQRALHTFWETGAAVLIGAFGSTDLTDLNALGKVAASAVLAGLASAFSVIKSRFVKPATPAA